MFRLLLASLVVLIATSCSDELAARRDTAASNSLKQIGVALQDANGIHNFALATHQPSESQANAAPCGSGGDGSVGPTAPAATSAIPPTADRQIIYRASINLQVKNFAATEAKITALVKASSGFVSQFSEDRSSGAQRGGRWTIRLPVANFTSFLDAVAQLGVADRREVQSQDVTEEYVDLEARLKNKRLLESRLLDLVANRSDHIKDVIALETELSRVREEIERLEGRLRYLKDRVSLTTIEISAYERQDYEPPEATFSARVASTFRISLDNLRRFAEACIIAVTAVIPWLLAASALLLAGLFAMRRRLRQA